MQPAGEKKKTGKTPAPAPAAAKKENKPPAAKAPAGGKAPAKAPTAAAAAKVHIVFIQIFSYYLEISLALLYLYNA